MVSADPPIQKHQAQNIIPRLSYSIFAKLVLPFLYPFLTDVDPRPTFILSSSDAIADNEEQGLTLVFANKAFQDLQRECGVDIVQRCVDHVRAPARPSTIPVREGLQVHVHSIQTTPSNGWFCYAEHTPMKLPESKPDPDPPRQQQQQQHAHATNHSKNYIEDDVGTELVYTARDLVRLDWTRGWCPMAIYDSEHYQFLRSFDWASTPLGPYTHWSKSLRAVINAIMPLKKPMVLYYGKDARGIYNSAFRDTIAWNRHPGLMAKPFREGWPEALEYVDPIFQKTIGGIPTVEDETLFLLDRALKPEEIYFNFEFSPLIDDDGSFMGALCSALENTKRVIKARRTKVTHTLVQQATEIKDLSLEGGFWDRVLEAVDLNPLDSPFAIIYRVEAWKICRLIGGRGLPDQPNEVFTDYFDLGLSPTFDGLFQPQFKHLSTTKQEYVHVEFTPQQLDQLSKAGMNYRGFGKCRSAVVIPFYQGSGPPVKGFLVLGLNDRRVFDEEYREWIGELARTLWRMVDIVWTRQEEDRVQREHSSSIKVKTEEIVMALQKTTRDLKESELLFARTADLIPVGLVCLDAVGSIIYSNDAWHQLCFLPRGEPKDSWPKIIYAGDRDELVSTFTDAIIKKTVMSMEFRIGNDDTPGGKGWLRWARNSVTPNFDGATGQLTGFVATVVDITAAKDAAEYQRQLTIEAVESKRQQDNFIDVTSHELRNPLTAILQSADEITQLLKTLPETSFHTPLLRDIDQAASTIVECGEHQRKIINDILSVSKMDAGLLTVEPVPVQPHVALRKMMKMFGPEFKAKGITSEFKLSAAYEKYCEQHWWSLDPARLTQIAMNLVTNAVKFTATKNGIRQVRVSLDASTKPPDFRDNFHSSATGAGAAAPTPTPPPLPRRPVAQRARSATNMTPARVMYLLVCVEDTGIGISKEWRAVMGQRYRQAPKTHISYGGSGLGLFIARQLAFLLDGELHFDSEVGVGSTFSFYVRCEQCSPPEEDSNSASSSSSFYSNSSTPTTNASPQRRGTGMDVLVVEDNIINQKILRRQLEVQGCRVDVASNGVEALEVMAAREEAPFTVVLMDMEMPVMDGITATERIRAIEQARTFNRRHVPIIGTSANARLEHIDRMLLAGMDDVITKPFVVSDLMSKMEHVLRVRQVNNNRNAVHGHAFLPTPTS